MRTQQHILLKELLLRLLTEYIAILIQPLKAKLNSFEINLYKWNAPCSIFAGINLKYFTSAEKIIMIAPGMMNLEANPPKMKNVHAINKPAPINEKSIGFCILFF